MGARWLVSLPVLAVGAALTASACFAGEALPASDALTWLQRIATAARQLNYVGTFVYQHGDVVETSRIVHVNEAGNEIERLQTLDGPRREVLRTNDRVYSYVPDSKVLRVERRRASRTFPQLLPEQLTAVTDHYHVRKADVERVAEHDAQALVLEPKDGFRYGHKFWADLNTGLLLKAKMYGEGNKVMEQFAFTQLQIGGAVPREWLRPSMPMPSKHEFPEEVLLPGDGAGDSAWIIRSQPAGFRKVMETRRARDANGSYQLTHIVLSDGLAAVSVFIEAGQRNTVQMGLAQRGPIHIYTRMVGDTRITVLGEAPASTVMQIGDSLAPKIK